MGVAFGEKFRQAVDRAIEKKYPFITPVLLRRRPALRRNPGLDADGETIASIHG